MYIYIYMFIEREREIRIHIYIYIYVCMSGRGGEAPLGPGARRSTPSPGPRSPTGRLALLYYYY